MVKDLIGHGAIYGSAYGTMYDTIHLTIHQKGGHRREAGAFGARPPVVESVVVDVEMYGVIYGAMCPTINGTMAPAKALTKTY